MMGLRMIFILFFMLSVFSQDSCNNLLKVYTFNNVNHLQLWGTVYNNESSNWHCVSIYQRCSQGAQYTACALRPPSGRS